MKQLQTKHFSTSHQLLPDKLFHSCLNFTGQDDLIIVCDLIWITYLAQSDNQGKMEM